MTPTRSRPCSPWPSGKPGWTVRARTPRRPRSAGRNGLSEPFSIDYSRPKVACALAVVAAAKTASSTPWTVARHAAVWATIRRLVPLAAHRHRGQVRAVGLDQQPVQRHLRRHVAQVLGVLVRQHAGERDVQAHRQARLGRGRVAGERVHHAADRAVPLEVVAQHAAPRRPRPRGSG